GVGRGAREAVDREAAVPELGRPQARRGLRGAADRRPPARGRANLSFGPEGGVSRRSARRCPPSRSRPVAVWRGVSRPVAGSHANTGARARAPARVLIEKKG